MNPQLAVAITGKNMAKPAFDSVVGDANKVANSLQGAGARASGAMDGAGFATSNLAAQFNDIGVMLASGQSPLLLAIQQGTQISQVLGPMKAGAALAALKTALMSLVSPISLITIGTIAAGAALFQYLTSLNTDGRQSTEVIKEQNDLLAEVAGNWGEAVPALKAYVDQLDRAADVSDLNKATDIAVDRVFAESAAKVEDMRVELAAARTDLQALGASAQEIDALQAAFDALRAKVADGTASTADFDLVMSTLADTTGSKTAPTLVGFKAVLEALAPILAAATRQTAELKAQRDALLMEGPDPTVFYGQQDFVAEQERLNSLTSEQLALEQQIGRIQAEAKSQDVVITEQQALTLAQQRVDAEARRAAILKESRASAGGVSDLERERQAVADLIEELEHEMSILGMTNVEKEVQNALRQAGAAATEEERLRIEELVTATYAQKEAQEAATKQWSEYGNIGKSAVTGVKDALRDGKLEAVEMANLLGKVGDMFLNLGINALFGGLGGAGGSGNPLAGLFGFSNGGAGIVGGAGSYVPGGADDTLFIAKAQKGEPFAFGADAVRGIGGGNAGGAIDVRVSIDVVNGNLVPLVAEVSGQVAGQQIKANNRQLPNLLQDYQMRQG